MVSPAPERFHQHTLEPPPACGLTGHRTTVEYGQRDASVREGGEAPFGPKKRIIGWSDMDRRISSAPGTNSSSEFAVDDTAFEDRRYDLCSGDLHGVDPRHVPIECDQIGGKAG